MHASLSELSHLACAMPASERALLAEVLLESLQESPQAQVSDAWADEISHRVTAFEQGHLPTVPAEEVFAKARAIAK